MKKILSVVLAMLILASVFGIAGLAESHDGRWIVRGYGQAEAGVTALRVRQHNGFYNSAVFFYPGETVTIAAHPWSIANGQRFTRWEFMQSIGSLPHENPITTPLVFADGTNASSLISSFVMPENHLWIVAVHEDITPQCPRHMLTVVGGTGGGEMVAGQEVRIVSNPIPTGQRVRWESSHYLGYTVQFEDGRLDFVMPNHDITVTAVFESISLGDDPIGFIMGVLRTIVNFLARIFPFIPWPEL
ncbi:MAG: hypothetical protein FWE40_04120 [Oscillospiraceae bacterium]|nr:hypothetical protein [Oscillospiraceae bacterium]